MFVFEWLLKKIFPQKLDSEYDYNPLSQEIIDEEEDCNHEFMPVDSTGDTLACIKCGFVVQRNNNKLTED